MSLCSAAVAGLLFVFQRRKKQRVGLTDATSSADSVEIRKGLSSSLNGEVDPSEFVFCRNADGSEVCLGEGNFGKARDRRSCSGKCLLRA
jgi:hypothetical protein